MQSVLFISHILCSSVFNLLPPFYYFIFTLLYFSFVTLLSFCFLTFWFYIFYLVWLELLIIYFNFSSSLMASLFISCLIFIFLIIIFPLTFLFCSLSTLFFSICIHINIPSIAHQSLILLLFFVYFFFIFFRFFFFYNFSPVPDEIF